MTIELKDEAEFCDRLKKLGYTEHNRIRIYGEEFDLTSNPIMEEDGFAVEAICRTSGNTRKLRIPLSIVKMIARDLECASFRAACSATQRAALVHTRF